MDEKTTYWASIILGGAALLLLVVNMSIINGNRQLQEEITTRQTQISKAVTMDQLDKGIVQALADIAVTNSDTEARGLLAAQGITITPPTKSEAPKETKESKDSKKKSGKSE